VLETYENYEELWGTLSSAFTLYIIRNQKFRYCHNENTSSLYAAIKMYTILKTQWIHNTLRAPRLSKTEHPSSRRDECKNFSLHQQRI